MQNGIGEDANGSRYWDALKKKLVSARSNFIRFDIFLDSENKWDELELELEFQRLFLKFTASRCFEYQNLKDLCLRAESLDSLVSCSRNKWLDSYQEENNCSNEEDTFSVSRKIDNKIAEFTLDHLRDIKSDIREAYRIVSMSSLSHSNMSNRFLIEFIYSLLDILKRLLRVKVNLVDSLKIKLKGLRAKLSFLRILILFTSEKGKLLQKLSDIFTHVKIKKLKFPRALLMSAINNYTLHRKLSDLFTHTKLVTDNAIYLCYCCLSDDMNEGMVGRLGVSLSELLQDIDPVTPMVRQIYTGVLKAYSESYQPDLSKSRDLIASVFVDSLLENVEELISSEEWTLFIRGQIEILQEELKFLSEILILPPDLSTNTRSKATCSKAGSVVFSLYDNKMNEETTKKIVVQLLEEIKLFKTEIIEVYFKIPKYPCPLPKLLNTEELGFLDCFLGNLRDLPNERNHSIISLYLPVELLMEELQLLRSSLSRFAKQHTEQVKLKALWTRVIGVTCKAEFIIDSVSVGNGLRWKNFLWSCEVRKEIEALKAEFDKIDVKTCDIKIHSGREISYQVSSQATSSEIEDVVVGFEDEEERLVEDLLRGSTNLMMVSIVGMPGQGKTYLAKRVYNNLVVKDYFDARAWCYVSQAYKRKYLLTCILSQLVTPAMDMSETTDEELAGLLHKNLKGRRYLILMDDMWDVEAWNDLKRSFPDDKNGSRIMLTSRFRNFDLKMSARKIHHLRSFSTDESFHLLKEKLFQREKYPSELLEVGQEIARKCNGLPLIVVVVAGILARIDKKQPQWEKVANSLSSLIIGDPEQKPIKVIELSYNHLPDHLKPCFLYAGALLKEKHISVQKLIRLWTAEGFVHKVEPNSLESTAKDYLMDLIGRSLIMIADKKSTGDIKDCRVHDLVGDFCLEKAASGSFLQKFREFHSNTSYDQRRISCNEPQHFLRSSASSPHVRTLLFDYNSNLGSISPSDVSSIRNNFKLLRVLDLESIYIWDTFPDQINSLVFLRYLALRGNFYSVPPSIENLWNLLTFIVKGHSRTVHLPHTLWNMAKLQHLHIGLIAIPTRPSCDDVCMENLQTVSTLFLSSEDDAMVIVKALSNVKSLRCIVSKNCNQLRVLSNLSQLESLKLSSGQWFPTFEFSLPSNLKKLTMSRFCMPWNKISIIGELPNLEVLKLLDFAFSGEEWEMGGGQFPKLKFLILKCLDIMKWSESSYYFPPLEHLVMESCEKLEEIPSCLFDIPTLSKIEVRWCSNSLKELVQQIQEEQLDFGHQLKVEFD